MMQEDELLVKMANQIAANLVFHDDAVDRVCDHLQRFWAPSMRLRINEYEAAGGEGLDPVARAAVRKLGAGE